MPIFIAALMIALMVIAIVFVRRNRRGS